ncbi:MAG TPA: hypothetical protein VKT18_00695, partial [Acidimicrobiales bacterium]|nr:hypothetical protein [Acidimicrobiales bacterium]
MGRGAWAGPLYVGVAVVDATTTAPPTGTNDSKVLTAKQRTELQPSLSTWCASWGLGVATSREIDVLGLTTALRLAARRALAALPVTPTAVLVDGRVDFLSPRGDGTISMLEDDPGGP